MDSGRLPRWGPGGGERTVRDGGTAEVCASGRKMIDRKTTQEEGKENKQREEDGRRSEPQLRPLFPWYIRAQAKCIID